jgi:isopenicillin-N N-acyltransferase-like protein
VNGAPIRSIDLVGTPTEMGTAHGMRFAEEIRRYTADRVALSAVGTDMSHTDIIGLAQQMLDHHERYDADLFAEMTAMADAAGISAAEAVIVGGYTDFIDTVRAVAAGGPFEDNCTAVVVPDHLADGAGFLAQTWDMHASATPHVVMLRLEPEGKPASLVFTTVGTLGQIGMNDAGIAIGINNLTAADGRLGVTWPFVVRRALAQLTFDAAVECIVSAPLAGGHSFLVLSASGEGCIVEAMPTRRHVFDLGSEALVHSNHCLVPGTQAVEGDRPAPLQASSTDRLAHASGLLAEGPIDSQRLMALTRDERSICRHPEPPFDYESCGAAVMRPKTGDFWACWGVPSDNEYEHFSMARSRADG